MPGEEVSLALREETPSQPLAELWVGFREEDSQAIELVRGSGMRFAVLRVSGLGAPELCVGPYRYVGLEKIAKYLDETSA